MRATRGAVRPELATRSAATSSLRPLLTVVVPVYNGGDEIVGNIDAIRDKVCEGLSREEVEVIVVSDGSIDGTAERLLESRGKNGLRVIHYDRNLGKGYAVKAGALASHAHWIALVDGDLDLDPASIPSYLALARRQELDFAIGSKRHPESIVHYPRSRRAASWCYQRLNRLLFRLDVRDTQVGLKVFSREVADNVLPLLLVKRYAFDLELLAVAASLGYDRIREMPIRLDYRFASSGVRSLAVLGALWDTCAIFYRLRVLRTYDRKRRILSAARPLRPEELPLVEVVGDLGVAATLDYPRIGPRDGAQLVAIVGAGARPASNWVSAAVPYFADPKVAAIVAPMVAPLRGRLRDRVAAAVLESRLGGASRRLSYFPGNVRVVVDYPGESIVMRCTDYEAAADAGIESEGLVAWLAARGRRTIYTPDTSLAATPRPLVRPHLADTVRYAGARGRAARRTRGRSLSGATAISLTPGFAAAVGAGLVVPSGRTRKAGFVLVTAYAAALGASGIHAAARFRSISVGLLEPPAAVASQVAYAYGFVRGLLERPKN